MFSLRRPTEHGHDSWHTQCCTQSGGLLYGLIKGSSESVYVNHNITILRVESRKDTLHVTLPGHHLAQVTVTIKRDRWRVIKDCGLRSFDRIVQWDVRHGNNASSIVDRFICFIIKTAIKVGDRRGPPIACEPDRVAGLVHGFIATSGPN